MLRRSEVTDTENGGHSYSSRNPPNSKSKRDGLDSYLSCIYTSRAPRWKGAPRADLKKYIQIQSPDPLKSLDLDPFRGGRKLCALLSNLYAWHVTFGHHLIYNPEATVALKNCLTRSGQRRKSKFPEKI